VGRKKISVYVSEDMKAELETIKKNDREIPSMNSIIVAAIKMFLLHKEKQKQKKLKEK
jgi:metal-responsive CopG/Arc/MetJ family transcriptional regulator